MREPAKSCFTCRAALPSVDIWYTPGGEIVCRTCFPAYAPPFPAGAARSWQAAMERRARTHHRRRLLTGIVFAWMVAGLFVAWQLHASLTIATIDAPLATSVPPDVRVAGHVVSGRMHRPLWIVAQSPERCPGEPGFATPVVAHTDGSWELPIHLEGHPGQKFLLTMIAADELADAALERGDARGDAHDPAAARRHGPGTTVADCPSGAGWLDLPPGSAVLASREITLEGAPTRPGE